jgi:hypothetical protein
MKKLNQSGKIQKSRVDPEKEKTAGRLKRLLRSQQIGISHWLEYAQIFSRTSFGSVHANAASNKDYASYACGIPDRNILPGLMDVLIPGSRIPRSGIQTG